MLAQISLNQLPLVGYSGALYRLSGYAICLSVADSRRQGDNGWSRTRRVGGRDNKLLGDDADLCGIAELRKELLAVVPGEGERAYVGDTNPGYHVTNECERRVCIELVWRVRHSPVRAMFESRSRTVRLTGDARRATLPHDR